MGQVMAIESYVYIN